MNLDYANIVIIDEKEGGETEVVSPSNWLEEISESDAPDGWKVVDGFATCLWWPAGPAKKMEKFHVNNRTQPNRNVWTSYEVIRIKMYGDKKTCESCPITTDNETTYGNETDETEESEDEVASPEKRMRTSLPTAPSILTSSQTPVTTSTPNTSCSLSSITSQLPLPPKEFQLKVFKNQIGMERRLMDMLESVQRDVREMKGQQVGPVFPERSFIRTKQAQTIEDFKVMDQGLEDQEKHKKIVEEFCMLGADNIPRAVSKFLLHIMSNEVMMLFSLYGKKGKLAFKDTRVYKLLLDAVQRIFPTATEVNVDTELKERVLKFAKRRSANNTLSAQLRDLDPDE